MDNERYDDRLKFIVIGNCGTGKSCILHRFIEGTFTDSDEQAPTIGVDFGAKVVDILGRKVKMQIWDTTGQERYRSMTRAYYKGALGCLLVYDITNRDSFEAIEQWLADVKNHSGEKICVMLVGNKSDLGEGDRRQVTHIEASTFANNHGLMHFETSAATGDFIEEAFIKVAKSIVMQQQEQEKLRRDRDGDDGDDDDFSPRVSLTGDRPAGKSKACAC